MKTFALVENNIVVNLVIGDDASQFPNHLAVEVLPTAIPSMGWIYTPQVGFSDPTPAPVIVPQTVVPTVPQIVSRFQAKAALLQAGYLDSIETYMASADTPKITKIAWQDATEFRRTSPTVIALAQLLGMSDTQVDDLFILADKIKA